MVSIFPAAQLLACALDQGDIVATTDHWRTNQQQSAASRYNQLLERKGAKEANEWLASGHKEREMAASAVIKTAEGMLQLARQSRHHVVLGDFVPRGIDLVSSGIRPTNAMHFAIPNVLFSGMVALSNEQLLFMPAGKYGLSAIVLSVGSEAGVPLSHVELVLSKEMSVAVATFDTFGRRKAMVAKFSARQFAASVAGVVPLDEFAKRLHKPISANGYFPLEDSDFGLQNAETELQGDILHLGDYLKQMSVRMLD